MAKHLDPKFKCSSCEKMLKSKRALDAHERDHTQGRYLFCVMTVARDLNLTVC